MIGSWEIILIVLIVLILFGANKIPEFVRAINAGLKEFKKATNDIENITSDEENNNN